MLQAVRSGIRGALRLSSTTSFTKPRGGSEIGWPIIGARALSASAQCSSPNALLDKEDVTSRVLDLLKSLPFIDPSKVSPTTKFKDDLQLDMLESVEVMMAVEDEFAVSFPESDANKMSTAAHLIDYIATHPEAK